MKNFRLSLIAGLCILSVLVATPAISAVPASTSETRHASGIMLVGPGPYQARPKTEAGAQAHDNALRAAQTNPEDFGYPWLDEQGALVQRYTTPKGKLLSAKTESAVPRLEAAAQRSYKELERIKYDITLLERAGIADTDTILGAGPDEKNNRIIITVNRLSARLMAALVRLYGFDAVAVHIDPLARRPQRLIGRANDSAPYSGGAYYFTPSGGMCTLGFPWTTGFITAAHCTPEGGISSSLSSQSIGQTQPTTDENWNRYEGSMEFPSDDREYFRGDLAIIRVASTDYFVNPQIYVGAATSTTRRWVTQLSGTAPRVDDRYCTGGAKTGEVCEWVVTDVNQNVPYYDRDTGTTEWALNVTIGRHSSLRTLRGDSGGPVYSVKADGTVLAKGIISGGTADEDTTPPYYSYFTDIRLAIEPFPGYLKTAGMDASHRIVNVNSGKCLAIGSSSKVDGAEAIQYTCYTTSLGQTWFAVPEPWPSPWMKIINSGSGKCLAIGSSSTLNGAKAIQWKCLEGSVGQRWMINPDGSIQNGSGKCLAIGSSSLDNGANAIQWTCNGYNSQKWNWEYQN